MSEFSERYGPWALIAGGAQGIGEAYSRHVAAQGLNVVVLDISPDALKEFVPTLEREYGVECLGVEIDLARQDLLAAVTQAVGDRDRVADLQRRARGRGSLLQAGHRSGI